VTSATASVPKLVLPTERFELACGATLFVSPRPGATVTAARIHVRGGPALDPPGREGVGYLTGLLTDQGTHNHTDEEAAELLEPAAGDIGGSTSGLSGTIAGTEWKLLLELMADRVVGPTFPKAQVELHRKRIVDRLTVERDNPRVQGGQRFRKLVYGDHWLGRPAYGFPETVARIEAKHLRAHHRKHWHGRRGIIAVCGDVDPKKVKRHLDRCLADWNPGTPLKRPPISIPPRGERVDVFTATRQQVHVYLGHLGIRRSDPDYPALVVMDHVLGTGPGFTNRISRRLRDELGLAYSVHADIHSSSGRLPGTFTAYIGTSPENVTTAIQGFLAEMRRMQDEAVGTEELETAKSYLLGSFVLGFERASRRAAYMISAEVHEFPADNLESLPRLFAAVTAEDVQRVAAHHLFPEACCLSVAGPIKAKAVKAMLRSPGR